jgi:iron complex transport system substrate-binding protein
VQPRRTILVDLLGTVLDAQEKADEFLAFEEGYYTLVQEPTKDIPDSEKPTVYFEFYQAGYSAGPGNSFHDLLVETGAKNIVEEKNVAMPIVNAEYVIERKPDIIIRMSTYLDGSDSGAFEYLQNEMMNRAGLNQVPAVQNGKVYVVRDTLIVAHEVIGLLYYATWFHPDLFSDINPAAVYADYMQTFYGTTPQGVYVYP